MHAASKLGHSLFVHYELAGVLHRFVSGTLGLLSPPSPEAQVSSRGQLLSPLSYYFLEIMAGDDGMDCDGCCEQVREKRQGRVMRVTGKRTGMFIPYLHQ